MGGTGVIDRFLEVFTSYIDSGFGLLGSEVGFLAATLVAIDLTLSALVDASQGAAGALEAAQAGNQLVALQVQQLADLTAMVAAQGRAQSLEAAARVAAQDQAREQLRRFLAPNGGYQPSTVRMFHE